MSLQITVLLNVILPLLLRHCEELTLPAGKCCMEPSTSHPVIQVNHVLNSITPWARFWPLKSKYVLEDVNIPNFVLSEHSSSSVASTVLSNTVTTQVNLIYLQSQRHSFRPDIYYWHDSDPLIREENHRPALNLVLFKCSVSNMKSVSDPNFKRRDYEGVFNELSSYDLIKYQLCLWTVVYPYQF